MSTEKWMRASIASEEQQFFASCFPLLLSSLLSPVSSDACKEEASTYTQDEREEKGERRRERGKKCNGNDEKIVHRVKMLQRTMEQVQ